MIVALVRLASGFNRDYMGEILPHWPVIQLSWELLRFVSVEGGILSSFTCWAGMFQQRQTLRFAYWLAQSLGGFAA
jgi:hypothetical protein